MPKAKSTPRVRKDSSPRRFDDDDNAARQTQIRKNKKKPISYGDEPHNDSDFTEPVVPPKKIQKKIPVNVPAVTAPAAPIIAEQTISIADSSDVQSENDPELPEENDPALESKFDDFDQQDHSETDEQFQSFSELVTVAQFNETVGMLSDDIQRIEKSLSLLPSVEQKLITMEENFNILSPNELPEFKKFFSELSKANFLDHDE